MNAKIIDYLLLDQYIRAYILYTLYIYCIKLSAEENMGILAHIDYSKIPKYVTWSNSYTYEHNECLNSMYVRNAVENT